MKQVASIPYDISNAEHRKAVVDFGVSNPHEFWYDTADGTRHAVALSALP